MQPVRIRISKRRGNIPRQLALQAHRRLQNVRRTQTGAELLDNLRRCLQSCQRWNVGKEIRIGDHKLLLNDPVVTLRRKYIRESEAVVESSEACAENGFGLLGTAARRPGNGDAGSKIAPVVYVRLCLIAQAGANCDVGTDTPIVAHERTHVYLMYCQAGNSRCNAELCCAAAQLPDGGGVQSHLLKRQGTLIALYGRNIHAGRVRVFHVADHARRQGTKVRIQNRRVAGAEAECPVEVLRRCVVVQIAAQAHAELQDVSALRTRGVIL